MEARFSSGIKIYAYESQMKIENKKRKCHASLHVIKVLIGREQNRWSQLLAFYCSMKFQIVTILVYFFVLSSDKGQHSSVSRNKKYRCFFSLADNLDFQIYMGVTHTAKTRTRITRTSKAHTLTI